MSAPADSGSAASRRGALGRGQAEAALATAVIGFLFVALLLTWWRLLRGADLVDEAFSVLVPWRWALGDRPFVDEQNLSQSAGLVSYPFVKLYAVITGNDATGLVLFDRHLYLVLCVAGAVCVYMLARRSLSATLAALVAAPVVTVVLFDTPQVTANTLGALLLTAGAALCAVALTGGSRWWAFPAGVAVGLACVAYPTVLLMTPFIAVCLAFSLGERVASALTPEASAAQRILAADSGRRAWRVVSAWALGGFLVVAPVGAAVVGIAGTENLRRCWGYTTALARHLDQLGGTSKAGEIAVAFLSLVAGQWFIVGAAAASLLVFRFRPTAGRWLLLLTPPAFWLTGTVSGLGVSGAVILYGLSAPYLYLYLPPSRRRDAARLLVGVWVPAVLVGAMTAYTSADGLVRAAVGLLSALVVSGLFLAWGLQPLTATRRAAWPAVVGLAAVVVATLAFQIWPGDGAPRYSALTARMKTGPWAGISLTEAQRSVLDGFAADLAETVRPGDGLLAYPQAAAFYLYWTGDVTANTYQLYVDDASAQLPKATVSYFRRHREAPTLAVHVMQTGGRSTSELRGCFGGLDYPPTLVAPGWVFGRRPPGASVQDVLARLPRL